MAEIKVIDKTSQKALYEYNDLIVNEKTLKGNSKSQLKIDENVKIDYNKYNDLVREGTMVAAKEKGLVRQEGKEYIMQDGDIVYFRFNV